jgi:hypothetical protein
MRHRFKKTACLAALACAVAPAAAFAAGGVPGGGGTARPVGGGGGGANAGGVVQTGGSATSVRLSAVLGHSIDSYAFGTVAYRQDGTRRQLSIDTQDISVGVGPFATAVDMTVNGAQVAELPVSPLHNGSASYSADTNAGDSVPTLTAGAWISVNDAATGWPLLYGALG